MNRDELGALLRLLVDSGRLTAFDASLIVRQFDNGTLDPSRLPVPMAQLPGAITVQEQVIAIRDIAAVLPQGTGAALLRRAAAPEVIVTSTPPEVREFLRKRLRDHFRFDYERRVAGMTKALADGGDIQVWQNEMVRANRSYLARMYTVGAGRPLAAFEVRAVSQLAIMQQSYLQRFAGEITARQILDRPYSEAYLVNRAQQYGGSGWEAYWRGEEQAQALDQDGYIVHYQAKDDGNVCGPCLNAQNNGPYVAGTDYPRPGQVCRGHGLCRCTLRIEYDLEAWQRLSGERIAI